MSHECEIMHTIKSETKITSWNHHGQRKFSLTHSAGLDMDVGLLRWWERPVRDGLRLRSFNIHNIIQRWRESEELQDPKWTNKITHGAENQLSGLSSSVYPAEIDLRKGLVEREQYPLDFEIFLLIFSKKACFLSHEWVKWDFITFDPYEVESGQQPPESFLEGRQVIDLFLHLTTK